MSCVNEEGCVCDACLDNSMILIKTVRHRLDTTVHYRDSLLLHPGFADQRNADVCVSVTWSAEADASYISCDEKKLDFLVWERGAHSSAESNTL